MVRRVISCLLALVILTLPVLAGDSPEGGQVLLGDFDDGWDDHWKSKRLYRPLTKYDATMLDGKSVLRAKSKRSASLFYRELEISEPEKGWISWRWRVERSLTANTKETEKKGDDYSARVFVVFDPGLLGRNARSICYVWAGNQPVGATYPNPYAENVKTVVLQSGDERAGEWVTEKRDILADFKTIFGGQPPSITAVAVMVDTDNTRTEVQAWFDDIVLAIGGQTSEFTKLD